MKIHEACKGYFNGPKELLNYKQNSTNKNAKACLKTISYLIVPFSIPAAIIYGISSAFRFFKHKQKPETKIEIKTHLQGNKHLPKVSNPKPKVNNTGGPTVTQMDSINAPRETSLIAFPGDLGDADKFDFVENNLFKLNLLERYKLDLKSKTAPQFDISIRRHNIFESKSQVIVNAANDHLQGGGGIDRAVNNEGGAEYTKQQKSLRNIPEYKNRYVTGHASMIGSGDIKDKYKIDNVIVVAGPNMNGINGKNLQPYFTQLYSCYYNSLVLAHSQGKISIAFPAISTGIFAFPKDKAAQISLRAIHDFISQYPNTKLTQISIHFLPSDPESDLNDYKNISNQIG